MSKLAKALTAAAGNAGGTLGYVEDVFSTYLYTGNGSTQTITNGIDLAGEGGMVWIKCRSYAINNAIQDTVRGGSNILFTNTSAANQAYSTSITSFSADGFSLGSETLTNFNAQTFASWTFRKAEKFFDVVTYTGDGVAGRTVAHNLGSTPAFIIVKQTNASNGWPVYHASYGATYVQFLNDYTSAFTSTGYWNDTAPTDSVFTVGDQSRVNTSGGSYVAYLFASDAGGFGNDGSESIIKCGSFTTDGSKIASVNCGFEPQWLLVKKRTTSSDWFLFDVMRGMPVGANPNILYPNQSNAESTGQATYISLTASGFDVSGIDWEASAEYIYIAIRRPMKTPESGTEVFTPNNTTVSSGSSKLTTTYPVDSTLTKGNPWVFNDRLRGAGKLLFTTSTGSETSGTASAWQLDFNNGYEVNAADIGAIKPSYAFRRATGFFDVVAYTGNGSATTVSHNLGVAPEMMIIKQRDAVRSWNVYASPISQTQRLFLNQSGAAQSEYSAWDNTAPTNTVFSVGATTATNASSGKYIAYLFATLAGVSKVGSYTGTGSNVDVDCGFSAGARFILIKRTDSSGDWYVWDSVRGIVAGNDPYLLLNSTAAEVTSTDYIDPLSSGFTVTSSAPAALNASGGSYIFMAIS